MRTPRPIMLIAALLLAGPSLARQPDPGTPSPTDAWLTMPPVTSARWFDWYRDTLALRLSISPRDRTRTFHFSQAGDDVSGNGTPENPYRTLAKAQDILDLYPAGDVALLFRRGDVWREPTGLDSAAPNVTIADYGSGDKPVISRFEGVAPWSWNPDPARPGVYVRDESATYLPGLTKDAVWVKQDSDRERPLARMASADQVGQTPGSWHWDHTTGLLYVHPRPGPGSVPVDPRNAPPFEVARPSSSGVFIRGHGSRVEDIVAEGWGMSRTVSATQHSGIQVGASGNDYVAVVGCESYYSASHAMAHWAFQGSGGVVTFVGCRAGLCNFNGVATETIFNTFALGGTQNVIFDSCEAAYGTLPSSEWDYATLRRGRGFYGHTYGFPARMSTVISKDCVTRGDNPVGCSNASHFGDVMPAFGIDSVRCLIVGETFYGGPGCNELSATTADAARVNCRYLSVTPSEGGAGAMANWSISGWAINCVYEIDARARTGRFALANNPSAFLLSSPKFWNCTFLIRTSKPSGLAFSMEYDMVPGTTGAELRNCIVMHEGPGDFVIGLGKQQEVLEANAYFGVVPSSYNGDARAITLAAPVPLLVPPPLGSPTMLSAHPRATGDAFPIGFDLTTRAARRRDRGAIDWSAVIGDLNSDLVLGVDDLYEWHRTPRELNGDGAVNAQDAAWLERAVRFDELQDMRAGRRPRPPEPPAIPGAARPGRGPG